MADSGELLGVMVESLVDGPELPEQLGFAAALSIQPLWNLLHESGVYPADNALFLRAVYDNDREANEQLLNNAKKRAKGGETDNRS